ncbi:S8 family serine peptidase [Algiphilus sp. W345]|uniref:S8 family serine peptidase n=1 Tax=Banduia mediterranea TaxID=3075609 RepID=A0ABU2WM98_9GAMM|nr:S8 family serine peptidase [Algiphilus sp. W345]MDT0498996.1 S8 family serine peptidase [Algiphilus sp. W345]
MNVYVIDTGLDASHVDFAGRIASGRNFAANSTGGAAVSAAGRNCPTPDTVNTDDCNGHGTQASGTAMGTTYGGISMASPAPAANSGIEAGRGLTPSRFALRARRFQSDTSRVHGHCAKATIPGSPCSEPPACLSASCWPHLP